MAAHNILAEQTGRIKESAEIIKNLSSQFG